MSKRISFGKNTPLTFLENLYLDTEAPYRIRYKEFLNEDIAPLHCGDTMEILVCCNMRGHVVIDGFHLDVEGNKVVVIPPNAVHQVTFHKGPGHVYMLNISFGELVRYVNIEELLALSGHALSSFVGSIDDFESILSLIQRMVEYDGDPFMRIGALLSIFSVIKRHCRTDAAQLSGNAQNGELRRVIIWTSENFRKPIALKTIAGIVGYSENYFCAWFKKHTRMTYNHYLNSIRVNCACREMVHTSSIREACFNSGFNDLSYFIQIFKKLQGCTPGEYMRNLHVAS